MRLWLNRFFPAARLDAELCHDGPAADDGKYIEIWKRQADGSWKIAYDIFNSDLPPM